MLLSILLLLLIIAIVVLQALQGLFSALIMTVLTLCATALAIGWYEYVAIQWVADAWRPNYAYALSLALVFAVPLSILRTLFDQLIKRAPLLPSAVDRVGAGICGLVTAFCVVGVSALTLQLIPFGDNVMGFQRIETFIIERGEDGKMIDLPPDFTKAEKEIFLTPDRFVVATANLLSEGLFARGDGKTHSLIRNNPDMVTTIGWVGSTESEVQRFAPPGSIKIVDTDVLDYTYKSGVSSGQRRGRGDTGPVVNFEPIPPASGKTYRMARVKLEEAARDERKSHLFMLRQFRLVGTEGGSARYNAQYYPIAIQTKDPDNPDKHERYFRQYGEDWPVTQKLFEPLDDNNEVEIVFEVPNDFAPGYLEYKLAARAAWPDDGASARTSRSTPARTSSAEPPTDNSASTATASGRDTSAPGDTVPTSGRKGRVRGATTRVGGSRFANTLPLTLKSYSRLKNVEVSRSELQNGHVVAFVDEQEGGNDSEFSTLATPSDKRLLQLNVRNLQARSSYGRALTSAVKTVQNYTVIDDRGNSYRIIGKFAVADVDGREVFELQYFPEQQGTVGGLGKFDKIQEHHLEHDYELVFLFLVDPGVRLVEFTTGGSASRKDDLSGENLVAPD